MSLKWLQSYDITRSADSDVGDSDVEKKKQRIFDHETTRLSGAHQEIQSNNIQLRIRTISNTLTVLCFFFSKPIFSLIFFSLSFLFSFFTTDAYKSGATGRRPRRHAVCCLQSAVCSLQSTSPRSSAKPPPFSFVFGATAPPSSSSSCSSRSCSELLVLLSFFVKSLNSFDWCVTLNREIDRAAANFFESPVPTLALNNKMESINLTKLRDRHQSTPILVTWIEKWIGRISLIGHFSHFPWATKWSSST